MNEVITALGLVFVIEGLVLAVLPGRLKGVMAMVERLPDDILRTLGLVAVGVGVGIVWLARQLVGG